MYFSHQVMRACGAYFIEETSPSTESRMIGPKTVDHFFEDKGLATAELWLAERDRNELIA